jgi:methylthioribose-1-phosphate isomerase
MIATRFSRALKYENEKLFVLDQQMLPLEEKWLFIEDPLQMIAVIQSLKVRGAPLIGVAAALSLADWYQKTKPQRESFVLMAQKMREARPTAINLMNAVDRLLSVSESQIVREAESLFDEDVELCEKMSLCASRLIQEGDGVLTHCNTGGLATVGLGTALGGITKAWQQNKKIHVYVDETRPLLQGARLTAWELEQMKISHTLICDNMAGYLMAQGKIQKVFVGTDRIALNGDFANKVGTYSVAVLCHYHKIPFYVVAPSTTVDKKCFSGREIPIEERKAFEVRGVEGSFGSVQWASSGSPVYNPAFDVTPVDLVTGLVIDDVCYSQNELKAGVLMKKFSEE